MFNWCWQPKTFINHQSEKKNKYDTFCVQTAKLCSVIFRFLRFLDLLKKKDARGRNNIIGCIKVGHRLSFEESFYGVFESWRAFNVNFPDVLPLNLWLWLGLVFKRSKRLVHFMVLKKEEVDSQQEGCVLPEEHCEDMVLLSSMWGNSLVA